MLHLCLNFFFFSRNGGGAFLIPFFFFLITSGGPLYYLEVCLGQFTGMGAGTAFEYCPLFKGKHLAECHLLVKANGLLIFIYSWFFFFLWMIVSCFGVLGYSRMQFLFSHNIILSVSIINVCEWLIMQKADVGNKCSKCVMCSCLINILSLLLFGYINL